MLSLVNAVLELPQKTMMK